MTLEIHHAGLAGASELGLEAQLDPHGASRTASLTGLAALGAPVVLLGAALALPELYAGVFLHELDLRRLPTDQAIQLGLSTCANLAALTTAFSVTGRFDRKLTQFAAFTLLVHGLLATAILGFRLFYLKSWFFSDALLSLFAGAAIVSIRHRAHAITLAVLDSRGRARQLPVQLGEVVADPSSDISRFDILLLTDPEDVLAEWAQPLSRAMLRGQQVRHWAEYLEETQGRVSLEHFQPDQLRPGGLVSYGAGKRVLDLAVVALLAPLAVPVVALAALAILACRDGPVFFSQMRVGRGGRPFRIWKLRTMRPEPPEAAPRTTMAKDDRITPLGAVLRRFRIDELPQLWNVAVGEMSLIGPRPDMTFLAELYQLQAPAYTWRHLVRPGVTGWAQVRAGYASDLAEAKVKLSYDLFYVKNMSLPLDLQILARTFWTIVAGGGVR